jgi:hypothetical protein
MAMQTSFYHPFYQVFSINFMKYSNTSNVDKLFSGLTFLLSHKTMFIYQTIFEWIRDFHQSQHWPNEQLAWQYVCNA